MLYGAAGAGRRQIQEDSVPVEVFPHPVPPRANFKGMPGLHPVCRWLASKDAAALFAAHVPASVGPCCQQVREMLDLYSFPGDDTSLGLDSRNHLANTSSLLELKAVHPWCRAEGAERRHR